VRAATICGLLCSCSTTAATAPPLGPLPPQPPQPPLPPLPPLLTLLLQAPALPLPLLPSCVPPEADAAPSEVGASELMLPPLDVLRLDAGSERGAAVAIAGAPVSEDTGATAGANWPAFAASSSWLREMSSKVRSRLESCSMDDIARHTRTRS
jgi:hypothetical protein